MNLDDLRKLQDVELKMLVEFIKICDRHNLRYFVIGGTCLGAVRHSGFIPWDDDIDIGMPRKDYTKFQCIAPNELPEYLFVQHFKSESGFLLTYSKIRNSNTTFIEETVADLNINHGVYIDIFPLDGVPNCQIKYRIHELLVRLLANALWINQKLSKPRWYTKVIMRLIITWYSPSDVHKMITSRLKKYCFDDSRLVSNYFGAYGAREVVPKDYFGEGCKLKFEGISVNAPSIYDKYLTNIYGDYMKLPPKDKQVSHHETQVIDLAKSYVEYSESNTYHL